MEEKDEDALREAYRKVLNSLFSPLRIQNLTEFLVILTNRSIPSDVVFEVIIVNSFLAVEFAVKKEDAELLRVIDLLIGTIQNGKDNLSKIFFSAMEKAKFACKNGGSIEKIFKGHEFNDLFASFSEKIAPRDEWGKFYLGKYWN
ncbi:hypothetical protein C4572_02060 [Candidatus Parcubacteria bacterium]|nr:MAG: hypothetical protein C4572_02060 [Candidatus Parcubacteria bacterium]